MLSRNQQSRTYASQRNLNQVSYYRPMVASSPAPSQRRSSSNRRGFKLKLLVIMVLIFGVAGHILWNKHVSAEESAAHQAQLAAAAESRQKAADFTAELNGLLAANPNDSISVATASTNLGLQTYGDSGVFDGASTAKLLTAADLLHHVEQGTASLDENLDGQTIGYWLKIMIINSDDTAWAELNGFLTHADLANYANSINFSEYDPSNNTFTAGDTALLLQELYNGKLLNQADRALLMRYLGEANYRQYIVAAVKNGDAVYHKVGLDDDTINDTAVIVHGQNYLVLTIFTNGNGTYDWPNRTQLIHTITKDAIAAFL